MKIFFDHQIFNLQKFGGVSNYIVNLVKHLNLKNEASIISLFHKNQYLKKSNFGNKFFFYNRVGFLNKYVSKINKAYFEYYSKANSPDIIHYTYFNEKIFYKSKAKKVITEYDLIKEKFYQEKYKNQIEYKKLLFDKVDQIICISNNTKKDLEEKYSVNGSKISVVHLGVNKEKNFRERPLNIKPFILYVGSRERYKNFENTIKAYAQSDKLKLEFDFVCFGGGKFTKIEETLFKNFSLDRKQIHYFEGDELDLNFFYHKARIFIFPSLYEGFGIPLLEAMNMECPVICSNTSCFSEVANDAAIFFDPGDVESLKFKMEKLIYDDQLLLDLKKKGNVNLKKYSWEKCAQETEQLYKKLV